MKRKLMLACLTVLLTATAFGQRNNFWSLNEKDRASITPAKSASRVAYPGEIKLFNLELEPLQQELLLITGVVADKRSTIISLPNAAGGLEEFQLYEASNFEPALQAQFPEIRSYSGKGISDKHATVRLSISPQGVQTMVFRADADNEFIEAYSADAKVYAVYKGHRSKGSIPWKCSTVEQKLVDNLNGSVSTLALRSTGDMKTLRLAMSVTAEYSNYFGATSSAQAGLVLAAVNNTLTRCNAIFERDHALHLNLVANTTSVFYYNASTDPYSAASTGSGGSWSDELQATLTSVIGEANYDIGHLLGASGGGGNAGCIGCVCENGSKGSAFTSPSDNIPQGDNFDIDYVAHEIGHQLGANHTFSMDNEGTGVNKEPGSGITIMGYAGITDQDLAAHSYDFFHQASIAQVQANLATRACAVTTSISSGNATPVINTGANYTIPKSTPFYLSATATDANGDALTYCWEQNDNAGTTQVGAASVASAGKTTGPNWISFRPTSTRVRYFPQMSSILAGRLYTGPMTGGDAGANTEYLSSVSRTLRFRLTVRDNAVYRTTAPASIGQTTFSDRVITVASNSGPFVVTSPNTAVSWVGGTKQTVTWNVAGTTATPVACANVKIMLSTDGGLTFPTTLLATTPNDGTELVTIPNTPTATARIMIQGVGNVFFDVSNTNFTITAGSACASPAGLAASNVTTTTATVSWSAVTGASSYTMDYKTSAATTWTNAATATTLTGIDLSGLNANTTYDVRVRTNCVSGSSAYSTAQFTTSSPEVCNAPTGLSASSLSTTSAVVSWAAVTGALSYTVEYKTAASGTWLVSTSATTATSRTLSGLTAATTYDWRVRTNCTSGSSGYSSSQFTTTTVASTCVTAMEPNETMAAAVALTSGVGKTAAISSATDVDFYKITTTTKCNIVYYLVGPSGVNYNIYIYNSAGTRIGGGTGTTATEKVTMLNQPAGTYYFKIVGWAGVFSNSCYTIKATASSVSCQGALDNTTNGTISGAATIPFNTNNNGLISPSGDIDHYKFLITNAGTVTITLGNLVADYDLKLLSSTGSLLNISENAGTSSESISRTLAAGTYYVQVFGYSGANSSSNCYNLKVQLGTASRDAEDIVVQPAINIYPNPVISSFKVTVEGLTENVNARLTDVYGRLISTTSFSGTATINTERLPAGVYLLTINNKKGEIIKQEKVLKQ